MDSLTPSNFKGFHYHIPSEVSIFSAFRHTHRKRSDRAQELYLVIESYKESESKATFFIS